MIIRIPWVGTFANLDDFLYATVNIAVWSNIETGLGISAGSLATLRPLFRRCFGKSSQDPSSYNHNRGSAGPPRLLLGSLESDTQRRLRPDKLAVTVTTVQSQLNMQPGDERDSYERSSQEQLTERPPLPGIVEELGMGSGPGTDSGSGSGSGSGTDPGNHTMGMGIHRTVELTQTGEYI